MKLAQIMLYVNNQKENAKFWVDNFGFEIVRQMEEGPFQIIELSDGTAGGSLLVLQDKQLVMKNHPEVNTASPSIMFETADITTLYTKLQAQSVTVGELVEMPTKQRVFNFSDTEGNYFAVMEVASKA